MSLLVQRDVNPVSAAVLDLEYRKEVQDRKQRIWKQARDNAEQIWNFSGKMFKKTKIVFLSYSMTQTFKRRKIDANNNNNNHQKERLSSLKHPLSLPAFSRPDGKRNSSSCNRNPNQHGHETRSYSGAAVFCHSAYEAECNLVAECYFIWQHNKA